MLTLKKDLPSLADERPPDSLRAVARARTLTVLSRLDGARKGNVVQFLYEASLINKGQSIVSLSGADLGGANLFDTDLSAAYLSAARLTQDQLAMVRSLERATMPNGQKYEDWLKDRESRKEDAEKRNPS